MKSCKVNAKVLFGFFNVLFFVGGFVLVACGFLLLCDSSRVLLSRLLAPLDSGLVQPPFYYVALSLMAGGLVMCAGGAIGCWATYAAGYLVLTLYFVLVLLVLVGQCAVCAVLTAWPGCVALAGGGGAGAAGGARVAQQALQAGYGVSHHEQYTAAVDLAQTLFECCGMTDGRNYDMSVWQLQRLGPRDLIVPLTCCTQDPETASYLDPQPYNITLCQEFNADLLYRNSQGCLGKLEDWYHQHYIGFLVIMLLMALCELGVLLSTVLSCSNIRKRRRQTSSFTVRSMNKMNENIYQNKLTADQPITAKYIQPNNFYSPRTRNPHIFHTKPNDMA